jgi:type I restriction enzyme S subunit
MAGEWPLVPLSKAIDVISGGTPKTTVPEYWNGDIPWLSVVDFNTGYRWVGDASKFITTRGLQESATAILNAGDIIISARGTVGVLAQLSRPMAFNQSCYGIRSKDGVSISDYIYYALYSVVARMKQIAYGGVFDTITKETFNIIDIPLPPLPEQRAIAHILGTLDDKIELNRKINQTLEDIAKAIFKNWFVDFEPVRAKAKGRDTGLPPHIADLFPDSFEDSVLGQIPTGWRVGALKETITYEKGQKAVSLFDNSAPGTNPYLLINALKHQGVRYTDEKCLPCANATDSIMVMDGASSGSIYIGFIGCLGSTLGRWRSKDYSLLSPYYLYQLLNLNKNIIRDNNTGSAIPHANKDYIYSINASLPPPKLNEAYNSIQVGLFSRMHALMSQQYSLTTLRDTLLPKLISGEMRVKDAEKFLENTL